mmetsp:Transcript_12909/g.27657  ORF Transcript_12909/g.27657 Transcript_12909/m.27657 type:complete len:155 (-) Transcript_12909:1247-1711(-)
MYCQVLPLVGFSFLSIATASNILPSVATVTETKLVGLCSLSIATASNVLPSVGTATEIKLVGFSFLSIAVTSNILPSDGAQTCYNSFPQYWCWYCDRAQTCCIWFPQYCSGVGTVTKPKPVAFRFLSIVVTSNILQVLPLWSPNLLHFVSSVLV